MPLFKYHCDNCKEKFEELVSYSESNNVECPKCGSHDTEKQVSAFATLGSSASSGSVNSCGAGRGGFT
jgi:putative FmdB family regulatory protein